MVEVVRVEKEAGPNKKLEPFGDRMENTHVRTSYKKEIGNVAKRICGAVG